MLRMKEFMLLSWCTGNFYYEDLGARVGDLCLSIAVSDSLSSLIQIAFLTCFCPRLMFAVKGTEFTCFV